MSEVTELPIKGLTLVRAERIAGKYDDDRIEFETSDGRIFKMRHLQDCCETVVIHEIVGDLSDLVGAPLSMSEESTKEGDGNDYGSETWTFYRFATSKGYVTITWNGSSNGYYSERVTFGEETDDN
jgi:hypothetical protein